MIPCQKKDFFRMLPLQLKQVMEILPGKFPSIHIIAQENKEIRFSQEPLDDSLGSVQIAMGIPYKNSLSTGREQNQLGFPFEDNLRVPKKLLPIHPVILPLTGMCPLPPSFTTGARGTT